MPAPAPLRDNCAICFLVMRHLLAAAAAVLMAGPAMAVDYVKCEAMQKALDRTRSEAEAVMKVVAGEISARFMETYCSENPGTSCRLDGLRFYEQQINTAIDKDPRWTPFVHRFKKIETDLKKAGCP